MHRVRTVHQGLVFIFPPHDNHLIYLFVLVWEITLTVYSLLYVLQLFEGKILLQLLEAMDLGNC